QRTLQLGAPVPAYSRSWPVLRLDLHILLTILTPMTALTRVSQGLLKVNGLERPCLVEIYGPNLGRTVFLGGPVTTLGRATECDIVLELDNVSRQHCAIHAREDGQFVRDGGSTNGTFVNDEEVDGERLLRAGDFVRLGSA